MSPQMLSSANTLAIWLMGVSALFLVYTYLLYPVLIRWLQGKGFRYGAARQDAASDDSRCASRQSDQLPPLTIIIAAYNAAEHIERKLANCLALNYPADRLSVLVASDGSTDGTNALVARLADHDARIRLMAMPERRGKPACINDAVAMAGTELMILTDARQRLDARCARRFVAHFSDPGVGIVSGALEIATDEGYGVVAAAGAYWRMETALRSGEAAIHSTIGVSGAIYALRRAAFKPIPIETILDDVLIPMTAVMDGWRVGFDIEAIAFDTPSKSDNQERDRKIRTLAGNYQLVAMVPALLSPWHNPVWAQFWSHKVFRLLAPWAMLVILLANIWLAQAGGFWLLLLLLQGLVYAVTMLPQGSGPLWRTRPMRLLGTMRGLIRLQWFAVLGLLMAFRQPSQPQLWTVTERRESNNTREPS